MQTTLAAIVTWLSINAGLPATNEYPRIEMASPAKMAAVRAGERAPSQAPGLEGKARKPASRDRAADIEALYDDTTRTIYLRDGWTGTTPAQESVLVHEMAHHLQNVAGLKYECPQAREAPAYAAQKQWLARSGRSLEKEFKLDQMTLLVRTKCLH